MWLEGVANIRREAETAQTKANEKMTTYLAKKNKVSLYLVGEDVLVENSKARTKHGKRVLDKMPSFPGRVIGNKGLRYKVQYENDEGGSHTGWFSMKQITTKTKDFENERQKMKENDKSDELMQALRDRLSRWDFVPEESEEDGNCLFRAVPRIVYGHDQFYQVRTIDWNRDNAHIIRDYILHRFESPQAYIDFIGINRSWLMMHKDRSEVHAEVHLMIGQSEGQTSASKLTIVINVFFFCRITIEYCLRQVSILILIIQKILC